MHEPHQELKLFLEPPHAFPFLQTLLSLLSLLLNIQYLQILLGKATPLNQSVGLKEFLRLHYRRQHQWQPSELHILERLPLPTSSILLLFLHCLKNLKSLHGCQMLRGGLPHTFRVRRDFQ